MTDNAAPSRLKRARLHILGLYALAALPVIAMAGLVHRAVPLHYADYWYALLRITHPDGSLRLRGIFTFQNEHPFVVPNTIYFLEAHLTGGSNRALGYYVVLVSVGCVVLLRAMLPKRWSPLGVAAVTAAIAAVLFVPTGVWNFTRGMSGTAWISANFFALLGIFFASRGHNLRALLAACGAMLSYGTGFVAPLAVAGIALLRREPLWARLLPLGALAGAAVLWKVGDPQNTSGGGTSFDPALLAATFLSQLGMVVDPTAGAVATYGGAAGLLVLGVGFAKAFRSPEFLDLAPWWGVATYTIGAGALIALARADAYEGDGVASRYTSLSALFWIAVLVVVLRIYGEDLPVATRVGAVGAVIVVMYALSPALVASTRSEDPMQNIAAVGLRIGAVDAFEERVHEPDEQIDRLRAMGNYPFSDDFTLGCGQLVPGDRIAVAKVVEMPQKDIREASIDRIKRKGDSVLYTGWVIFEQHAGPECVLLTDKAGRIVGGGTGGISRGDQPEHPGVEEGFEAVARTAVRGMRIVFGLDGRFYAFPVPMEDCEESCELVDD